MHYKRSLVNWLVNCENRSQASFNCYFGILLKRFIFFCSNFRLPKLWPPDSARRTKRLGLGFLDATRRTLLALGHL